MILQGREGSNDSPTYANMNMLQDLLNGQYSSDEFLVVTDPDGVTMAQQQSQYREPPPYPGHSKQMHNTPGLRQSFSGSETSTDVSVSSTENLSSSQRQEPQGEENQSQTVYHQMDYSDNGYSILARLGMPSTALEVKQAAPQPYYNMAGQSHVPFPTDHTGYLNNPNCCGSSFSWHNSSQLHPSGLQKSGLSVPRTNELNSQSGQNSAMCSNPNWTSVARVENLQPAYFTNLPPPPEYPGSTQDKPELRRSYETVEKSDPNDLTSCKSQPDLTRYWEAHNKSSVQHFFGYENHTNSTPEEQSMATASGRYEDIETFTTRANKMVELLTDENKRLRNDIATYNRKVSRLQKFELEIQRVHESYESLVKSSKKRERLEFIMKKRLEEEVLKLQAANKQLQEKIEKSGANVDIDVSSNDLESSEELSRKLAAVVTQNKELITSKETLELELSTQKATIQEQQSQLDILDNALTNAQANVVRLEKECCKKQVQMERLEQLQKSFSSLQAACEKREQLEKQLRTRLEKELDTLKSQQKDNSLTVKSTKNMSAKERGTEMTNLQSLQRLLNDKEAKILKLETEVIKWEQKYLEENALRQFSIQSGCSSDLMNLLDSSSLDDANIDKLKQLEEVLQARQQVSDLEAKVKSLQTELAEKDAMIRVFQRSPMTRSSSVHTLYGSHLHSPRPSLISTGSLTRQGTLSTDIQPDFPTIKHIKTGSTSALETGRKFSLDDDLASHMKHLTTESKDSSDSSEDDTGKIWQV